MARRYAATPAGVLASERLAGLPALGVAGDGRTELQVWSALYGAFLGIAIPGALGADGPEAYGAGLLLGAPAGFLFGRSYARERGLTEGQARAITLGGTWGAWQGYGWREVFELGTGETCQTFEDQTYCSEEPSSQEAFAALIVGSLAGVATGALLSDRPISPGVATTVNFGALWGSWFGLAGGLVADLEGDDLLATTLIAGNVGLLSMALLAPEWQPSRNRARLASIAGITGGLVGGGIDLILQPEDSRLAISIPLAASIAGLAIGIHATRNYDLDRLSREDVEIPGGSLVRLADGGWSLGMPIPFPVLRLDARQKEPSAGIGLTLLHASF